MICIHRKFFSIILFFSIFFDRSYAGVTPNACSLPNEGTRGATVKFYDYPYGDSKSFRNINFLLGGYLKNTYKGTVSGVTDISWDSGWPAVKHPYGFTGVPIAYFLMEITGYYKASQTGIYNIALKVDDSATIFMGAGVAFDCCQQHEPFVADEYIVTNVGSAAQGLKAATHEIYLKAGYYYPLKIVYINYMQRGVLKVSMHMPDGTVDNNIGENLYSLSD